MNCAIKSPSNRRNLLTGSSILAIISMSAFPADAQQRVEVQSSALNITNSGAYEFVDPAGHSHQPDVSAPHLVRVDPAGTGRWDLINNATELQIFSGNNVTHQNDRTISITNNASMRGGEAAIQIEKTPKLILTNNGSIKTLSPNHLVIWLRAANAQSTAAIVNNGTIQGVNFPAVALFGSSDNQEISEGFASASLINNEGASIAVSSPQQRAIVLGGRTVSLQNAGNITGTVEIGCPPGSRACKSYADEATLNWNAGEIRGTIILNGKNVTANVRSEKFDGQHQIRASGSEVSHLNFSSVDADADGLNWLNFDNITLSNGTIRLKEQQGGSSSGAPSLITSSASGEGLRIAEGGNLQFNGNTGYIAGNVTIEQNGRLGLSPNSSEEASDYVLGNSVIHSGIISLANNNTSRPDTLRILGDYVLDNGVLEIDANLTGDANQSWADRLVLEGTSASGSGRMIVNNVNVNAPTALETIQVVDVSSPSQLAFTLQNRVVSGGYEYLLQEDGQGDWYLSSVPFTPPQPDPGPGPSPSPEPDRFIRAEAAAYGANIEGAASMFTHGWRERSGNAAFNIAGHRTGWLLLRGADGQRTSDFSQIDTDYKRYSVLGGIDLGTISVNDSDDVLFGLTFGYGYQDSTSVSAISGRSADGKLNGFNLGAYASWTQFGEDERGAYLDTTLNLAHFNADVQQEFFGNSAYNIKTAAIAVEAGYSFDVAKTDQYALWLEPQVQLGWTAFDADDFTDASKTNITHSGNYGFMRLGIRAGVESADKSNNGFFQVDYLNVLSSPEVNLAHYKAQDQSSDAVKLSVGLEHRFTDQVKLSAGLAYTNEFRSSSNSLSANLGVKVNF